MRLLLFCLVAAALSTAAASSSAGEAAIDGRGNVIAVEEGDALAGDDDGFADGVDPTVPRDEQLSISVRNASPYRVDVYYDDGEYGSLISTLERDESVGVNSFIGHKFFVTRHGECGASAGRDTLVSWERVPLPQQRERRITRMRFMCDRVLEPIIRLDGQSQGGGAGPELTRVRSPLTITQRPRLAMTADRVARGRGSRIICLVLDVSSSDERCHRQRGGPRKNLAFRGAQRTAVLAAADGRAARRASRVARRRRSASGGRGRGGVARGGERRPAGGLAAPGALPEVAAATTDAGDGEAASK